MEPALWALLGFVAGGFTGAAWALAWRPYRFGCPRCRAIVGTAWQLGRHLERCGADATNFLASRENGRRAPRGGVS